MNYTRKLVIIGSSHHNTYSMVRCFGESGIKPDVILNGKSDSYILVSQYISDSYISSDAEDALNILQEKYSDAVVIACTDSIASLMDLHYDELYPRFLFFNCGNSGALTHYMDKMVQTKIASVVGFKVPLSFESIPPEVVNMDLEFPCIVKPLESIHGGKNIQICHSRADLPETMMKFSSSERVLVQEFVEKEYEIVVVGLSFEDKITIPAYIHKHRDNKGGTTYSTVKPIKELSSSIVSSCKRLIEEMKYQGLFGIELLQKGNDFYFIEVNLRNDATTYAIAVAGCNLPLIYWNCCNQVPDNNSNCFIKQINAMVEYEDFIFVLKRKVGIIKWLREYKQSECKYFQSVADPEPSQLKKKEYIKFLRKRIFQF